MSNKYYDWWKSNKPFMSLIPAVIFWAVSMIFFMVGLKFDNPIFVFGKDMSLAIAVSLSMSNTIIQIIGNEQESDNMGAALWMGWMASYLLGIGTNIVGLRTVLSVENTVLEWSIAIGLGTMIEVLPERLLVQFLKTFEGKKMPSFGNPGKGKYKPQHKPNHKPQGMPQHIPQRRPAQAQETRFAPKPVPNFTTEEELPPMPWETE